MGVRSINSKGHGGIGLRMSQHRSRGEDKLVRPGETLPRTLEGVGERSKDLSSFLEKSQIEVNHTKK